MMIARILRCLPLAIALLMVHATSIAHAASPACVPTGNANTIVAANTALNAGGSLQYTCTVTAGTNYNIQLDYDQGASTPGDAGNYIGVQLYRVNADDSLTFIRKSSPDGNDRETLFKTADGNETWFIKIENLATNPAYNTGAGVNVYIPGGQE